MVLNLNIHLEAHSVEMELCPGAEESASNWNHDHVFGGGERVGITKLGKT